MLHSYSYVTITFLSTVYLNMPYGLKLLRRLGVHYTADTRNSIRTFCWRLTILYLLQPKKTGIKKVTPEFFHNPSVQWNLDWKTSFKVQSSPIQTARYNVQTPLLRYFLLMVFTPMKAVS